MTTIAWDGKTLAADKRACIGTMIRTTTKIFKVRDCLVGYCGDAAFGELMLAWFKDGEHVDSFPSQQRDKDDWVNLLVIRPDGHIHIYERTHCPINYEDKHIACGSGREFALAAMHCGKTAREAVLVAIDLDNGSGNGVDTLEL